VLVGNPRRISPFALRVLNAEPPSLDAGLPSDLLERRPGHCGGRTQNGRGHAQSVSPAAYYPSFPAFRQGGWQAGDIAKLANASSLFWALGANVAQEIFTGGARRAQRNLRVPAMTRMSRVPATVTQCVSRSARRNHRAVRFDSAQQTQQQAVDRRDDPGYIHQPL